MRALLFGIAELDFKTQTGDTIKGKQLFIGTTDKNTVGYRTDKVFVREEIELPELVPNNWINLFFDRKGKVEAVTVERK